MFGNKEKKPDKVKIDIKFEMVSDSINNHIAVYDDKIEAIKQKIVLCKKQGNNLEATRLMETLKQQLIYRHRTTEILDKLEQFKFMIDEAFMKMNLYETIGDVMKEVGKVNMSSEVKEVLRELKKFNSKFSKKFEKMDKMFNNVDSSIKGVDASTNQEMDAELEAQIEKEMKQADLDTTEAAGLTDVSNWG